MRDAGKLSLECGRASILIYSQQLWLHAQDQHIYDEDSEHSTLNKAGDHKAYLPLRSYWHLRKGESVFFWGILIFLVDSPTCIHLDSPNWTQ